MVLVEYPLDSAKAEPFAHQTLDWLEDHLRSRFDTAGLPDEVADLSDGAEQVAVQLYLKHLSEAKPFTMRSFTWKVDDGFDELFGDTDPASFLDDVASQHQAEREVDEALVDSPLGVEPNAELDADATAHSPLTDTVDGPTVEVDADVTNNLKEAETLGGSSAGSNGHSLAESDAAAGFFSMSSVPMASVMLPDGEEDRVLQELEEDNLLLDLGDDLDVEDDLSLDLSADLGPDFNAVSEVTSNEIISDQSASETVASEAATDFDLTADFGLDATAKPDAPQNSDLSSDLSLDLEPLESTAESAMDSAGSGDALDADLSEGVGFIDVSGYPATDFMLPGETPAIESSELDLPTVDLPITPPAVEESGPSDFFSLVDGPDSAESDSAESDLDDTNSLGADWVLPTESSVDVDTSDVALGAEFISTAPTKVGHGATEVSSDESLTDEVPTDGAFKDEGFPDKAFQEKTSAERTSTETSSENATADLFDFLSPEPSTSDTVADDSEGSFTLETSSEETDISEKETSEEETPEEAIESVAVIETSTELDVATADLTPEERSPEDRLAEEILSAGESNEASVEDSESVVLSVEPLAETLSESSAELLPEPPTESLAEPLADPLVSDDLVPDDLGDFSLDASQMAEQVSTEAESAEASSEDSYGGYTDDAVDSPREEYSDDAVDDPLVLLPNANLLDLDLDTSEDTSDLLASNELDLSFAPADEDVSADASDSPNYDSDHQDSDHQESNDQKLDDYEYEEVTHDHEAYADDPVYYLEDEAARTDETGEEDYEEVVASVDETEVQRQRELWQQQTKSGNPMAIVGIVGLLFAGIVGFLLTRPCTVGGCDRIEAAQLKGDEALGNLRVDDSFDAVAASKKELKESILLLEPIPVWSSHYSDAQAILPEYDRQLTALDLVSEAQGKAYSAAVKSQNPPHSVSTWQDIASEWRAATTALSGVAEDSPVRELADRKLVEYRSNLSTVLVRIEAESGAEVSLRQAQQAASRATQQTPLANSSEAWEAVLSDWETAVENLRRIPQGTSAYAEAQDILPEFETTLQEVRDRAEQERSASRLLFRAQQLANDAQQAEEDELWTTAVERWNLAVIQLRDVPEGVFSRSTAQSLLTTYTSALATAENNMEVSLRFQPVEPSFFLVCGLSDIQKCSYSMASGKVRLDLVQGYDSVINESITPPPQRAGLASSAQLVSQSNQLLQQITLLSTQAQIPVELYDSNGDFLARYRPDLDGFVRQ